MRFLIAVATVAWLSLSLPAAAEEPAPIHLRGVVVSLEGTTLRLQPHAGMPVVVELPEDAKVALVERTDLSSITNGSFIGTTAVPDKGGRLRALEVHVFPEAMRGTGEGHRPWDLRPGSTMTNATVAGDAKEPKQGSMTNATVAKVEKAGAERTLSLKYNGGEQTVLVPNGIPIVKLSPGDRSALTPGAHVFVIASREANGSFKASRLTVGRGGLTPPM